MTVQLTGVSASTAIGSVSVKIISDADISRSIEERAAAKKAKNYSEADRIRKELLDAGIVLEDGPKGTTWRRS